jgi:VirB8 protein/TrbL/VirB6 plasmid conjugal transfer protein
MELNGLTTTLTHFISAFQAGYGHLQPAINGLLAALAAIEIVTLGFWWALGGGENLANVLKKVLFLGFWLWFTNSFQSNASAFVHSLVKAGLTAGGNPGAEALLLDPSQIAGMGLQATAPLAESLQGITYHIGDMLIFGLSYIVIMLSFVVMAIQVFLAVLEYYMLVTLVAITQSAANQLNAIVQQSDPFKRMDSERISIAVAAVVQLSKDTWQAEWKETAWDKGGNELSSTVWRGTFRLLLRVPDTEEQLATNPIGLFVQEFHWSKVQG